MTKIYVKCSGQGYPLVLIHGWGFDSRVWDPLSSTLNERYTVYSIDLPGFGQSPCMDWELFKTSLLGQLPEKFAIAGWSLGGMVATRLVLEEPQRITHLISIASSPRFIEENNWPGVPEANLELFYKRLTTSPDKVLQEFMALQLPGTENIVAVSPTIEGLRMGLEWLLQWDFRKELINVQIPALYMFGRLDSIISRNTMPVMQSLFPAFRYIMVSKAAHALFISHASLFVETLENFI